MNSLLLVYLLLYILTFAISIDGTLYAAFFTVAIYVIAQENGYISNLLKLEILQKIASFSFEFYMVHELILIVFRRVFTNIQYHWVIKNLIIAIPSFIISILLAIILNRYITKKEMLNFIKVNNKIIVKE